ncbi:nucleotidyltransferase family protein [Candidatus Gottesmanbacteria bacterium]|nr:nucleotidyltransferase family protein [Candidatus Gottesmanbacteria bacterium]
MSIDSLKKTIADQKETLQSLGVKRVGIFGSHARGEATVSSDLDLLIDFIPGKKTYKNFFRTTTLLEDALNQRVDALTPEALSPYIKPHIQNDLTYVQIAD